MKLKPTYIGEKHKEKEVWYIKDRPGKGDILVIWFLFIAFSVILYFLI